VVELLRQAVPATALMVAVDPGKVSNRVWLTSGERGLIGEPVSLPVLREGVDTLAKLIATSGVAGAPIIAVEATGRLHQAWVAELERRWPGSVRLFAPSETQAARAQLGSRRSKTDDRDCAALVWLARQGGGRPAATNTVDALLGTVRHRRGLVADRRVLQQRLHDQLQALCPGLSAPAGHGRALNLTDPTGQAVLACAAAFAGRPPTVRSLQARAPGRLTTTTARFWVDRWRRLLPPPADAELRAERLGRDLARYQGLQTDIAATEGQITRLLATTPGQILTTLPGVAAVRAASFAAHSLPIDRFPTPDHLYAATGLAPATWQSASLHRRGRISRQGSARASRRPDGHRLGPVPILGQLRRAGSRAARPGHAAHPGPGRPGPPRLPAVPCPVDNPAALRRSALSFGPAQSRAVTAMTAMPRDGAT
jgi:transposase